MRAVTRRPAGLGSGSNRKWRKQADVRRSEILPRIRDDLCGVALVDLPSVMGGRRTLDILKPDVQAVGPTICANSPVSDSLLHSGQ
jgi:hypothetical protein